MSDEFSYHCNFGKTNMNILQIIKYKKGILLEVQLYMNRSYSSHFC